MNDEEVTEALKRFVKERDWDQFHSTENLAKSISIEAGELLEVFQWGEPEDESRVVEELADVLTCSTSRMQPAYIFSNFYAPFRGNEAITQCVAGPRSMRINGAKQFY